MQRRDGWVAKVLGGDCDHALANHGKDLIRARQFSVNLAGVGFVFQPIERVEHRIARTDAQIIDQVVAAEGDGSRMGRAMPQTGTRSKEQERKGHDSQDSPSSHARGKRSSQHSPKGLPSGERGQD